MTLPSGGESNAHVLWVCYSSASFRGSVLTIWIFEVLTVKHMQATRRRLPSG